MHTTISAWWTDISQAFSVSCCASRTLANYVDNDGEDDAVLLGDDEINAADRARRGSLSVVSVLSGEHDDPYALNGQPASPLTVAPVN